MNCNSCPLCVSHYDPDRGSNFFDYECLLTNKHMDATYIRNSSLGIHMPPNRECDARDNDLQWLSEDIQEELQKRGACDDQSRNVEVC